MLLLEIFLVVVIRIPTRQEEKINIGHQKSSKECPQKGRLNLSLRLPEPEQMLWLNNDLKYCCLVQDI